MRVLRRLAMPYSLAARTPVPHREVLAEHMLVVHKLVGHTQVALEPQVGQEGVVHKRVVALVQLQGKHMLAAQQMPVLEWPLEGIVERRLDVQAPGLVAEHRLALQIPLAALVLQLPAQQKVVEPSKAEEQPGQQPVAASALVGPTNCAAEATVAVLDQPALPLARSAIILAVGDLQSVTRIASAQLILVAAVAEVPCHGAVAEGSESLCISSSPATVAVHRR